MANHKSALKRHRQSLKIRDRNRGIRSKLRTLSKKVLQSENKEEASKLLIEAVSSFHKAAQKRILHPNNSNRKISRLYQHVNQLS